MKLQSRDGALVGLRPLRYQFAGSPASHGDWDSNWLVIRGDVRLADGRDWSFEDPCLTTWEARGLCGWLRGVASGSLQPTSLGGGDKDNFEQFIEPNLAFSLAGRDDPSGTIRVHLSLGSRPPWLFEADPAAPVELFEFSVDLVMALVSVADAADQWEQDLAAFPVR